MPEAPKVLGHVGDAYLRACQAPGTQWYVAGEN